MDAYDRSEHLAALVNEYLHADDVRDLAVHRALGCLFTNWRDAMTDGTGQGMTELADRDIPLVIEALERFRERVHALDASLDASADLNKGP